MMTPDRIAVTTGFTMLGGWLMADPDAHLTTELRRRLGAVVARKQRAASLAAYETGSPTAEAGAWMWGKVTQRLGCRICMGLEWSVLAWWATRPPRQRISPLTALVEIGAINGLHLLANEISKEHPDAS